MKYLLLLFCALFMSIVTANAQQYDDVVYLKNGSVIKGMIVEQIPNESLKIQTRDGSLIVCEMDDVEKMAKELADGKRFPSAGFNKPKGYFGLVEVTVPTVILGSDFGFTMVNGYRVVPQFAVGVGVGLKYCAFDGGLFMPLYLHLRSDFLDRSVSPYLALDMGYNVPVSYYGYYGPMISPSLGVSYNVGKFRMTTGLEVMLSPLVELNFKVGFSF